MTDSVTVFPPGFRVTDSNGNPVNGAVGRFYNAGTTTPKTVYSNSTLTTAIGTTVTTNAAGMITSGGNTALVYVGTDAYKVVFEDAAGVPIPGFSFDHVKGAVAAGGAGDGLWSVPVSSRADTVYNVDADDYGTAREFDTAAGNVSVVLEKAAEAGLGKTFTVIRKGSSNTLTVIATGGDTVGGSGSLQLTSDGDSVTFASNGANAWKQIAFARTGLSSGAITSNLLDARVVAGLASVGDIKICPYETVPAGWLECDGSAVSRTTYADLFTAIGVAHGSGDGATTFNLPDYRGRFLRGWSHGATVDPDKASRTAMASGGITGDKVGSVQADALQSHTHTAAGSTSDTVVSSASPLNIPKTQTATVTTSAPSGRISTETRPSNAYVMFIILASASAAAGSASFVNTVHSTSGTPSAGLGINGDFAIDSAAKMMYGPKASGSWPTGVSLAGATYATTSSTSLAIASSGSKTLTVGTGLGYSAGTRIRAADHASPTTNYMEGVCTSYNASTGSLVFTSDNAGGSGTISSWDVNIAGDKGSQGATGTAATIAVGTVTTGAAGSSAAVANSGSSSAAVFDFTIPRGNVGATGAAAPVIVDYTFDTSSTADSDPGSGKLKASSATAASVATLYIDDLDRLGNNQAAELATWDDSTSSGSKGKVYVIDLTTPANRWTYDLTAYTAASGYSKLSVTHRAGTAAFPAGNVGLLFVPRGDKGADGAGTGDVLSNTSTSVDDELVLFNSTTGKNVKRATLSGLVKATSGVASAAVSGTDYAPATSGSAILKGNGSGGFSAAVSATDYAPATSGSSVLKANGAGGFANAAAGTDYMKPDTTSTISKGFTLTPHNIGTVSSGTTTPDPANGNYQYLTNNGAFTLAAPASDCAIDILVTNGASAGSITFSGFTVGSSTGSPLTTTNAHKFVVSIRRVNSVSTYSIYALQ